jgi:transcriptional regulator with XRE-family HTH domain
VHIPVKRVPGEWLRQQRVAAGLTQEDLAERSGVSVRAIADLERGRTKKPYPSSVKALVRALGLPEAAGTDLVARYRAGDGAAQADARQAADVDEVAEANGGVTVPRQLPTRMPHFAGRAGELAQLDGVLDAAASDQAVGARLLQLDVLSEQEANELLVTRLGKDRAAGEPWAVTELATLCARLPLAL